MSSSAKLPRPCGRRSALVIVDVQNDFCEGGSLPAEDSLSAIPVINNLRSKIGWDCVIISKDSHPKNHCSFFSTQIAKGAEVDKFKSLSLAGGKQQRMWPDHCVAGTEGANTHADLVVEAGDKVLEKGGSVDVPACSAFADDNGVNPTECAKILRKAAVTDVYVVGLSHDLSVGATAIEAAKQGFRSYVVQDATRHVAQDTVDLLAMESVGVAQTTSSVVLQQLEHKDDRRQQAANYMEEHSIPLLMQKLCTSLVYHKPADPKAFLVKELQKLQKQRRSEMSRLSLLTDEDLDTMFEMLDPIGAGVLEAPQVLKALAGLGLSPSSDVKPTDTFNQQRFKQLVLSAS